MYYRKNIELEMKNLISIDNYLNNNHGKDKSNKSTKLSIIEESYDFDSVLEYYSSRKENFIVGIIDKNTNKLAYKEGDIFKIRNQRDKVLDKKRGTGIPTFKGAVCSTSKSKGYLLKVLKKLNVLTLKYKYNVDISDVQKKVRTSICNVIRDSLLILEKYSTSKDKNKITYIMIPNKHSKYIFPYNLEDRIKLIIKELNLKDKDYKITKTKKKLFISYTIKFKKKVDIKEKLFLKNLGKLLDDKTFILE